MAMREAPLLDILNRNIDPVLEALSATTAVPEMYRLTPSFSHPPFIVASSPTPIANAASRLVGIAPLADALMNNALTNTVPAAAPKGEPLNDRQMPQYELLPKSVPTIVEPCAKVVVDALITDTGTDVLLHWISLPV